MSDRSTGEIQIGGEMPRKLVPEFVAHLVEAGLLDEGSTEEDLKLDFDGVLSFEDEEALGGSFFELESFLHKHGIDFDRQSSPSYYYDPDNVSWRESECWASSRDATDLLRKRIKALRDDLIDIWANQDAILDFVRRNGPPPKLKPFTVVDE